MPSHSAHPVHRRPRHHETHRVGRSGLLRATVLGANDGLLSTGALLLGVIAADEARAIVITAGIAGMAAGAASMAIGEYVSVSSQRDAEHVDRATEAWELLTDPVGEHAELKGIYQERGLEAELADRVASALMEHDPLGAHMRDELGFSEAMRARPVQAAITSFVSFVIGALVPIAAVAVAGASARGAFVVTATLLGLFLLGAAGAALGGARPLRASLRVALGGAAALALTYGVGSLVGTAIS